MPSLGNGFGHTKTIEKDAITMVGMSFFLGRKGVYFFLLGMLNDENCLVVHIPLLGLETEAETGISSDVQLCCRNCF